MSEVKRNLIGCPNCNVIFSNSHNDQRIADLEQQLAALATTAREALRGEGLIVTLPLPHQHLKPNSRPHPRSKAAKIAEYRAEAKDAAMAAAYEQDIRKPYTQASVQIVAYWPTVRVMDPDNLIATMKAAIDGITDAGIWDDDRQLTYLPCIQAKDADNPRILIRIVESQANLVG